MQLKARNARRLLRPAAVNEYVRSLITQYATLQRFEPSKLSLTSFARVLCVNHKAGSCETLSFSCHGTDGPSMQCTSEAAKEKFKWVSVKCRSYTLSPVANKST